ncbi:MAG: hypothetical protein PHF37_09140 [Phycisphaerae bacterium]|nr:hypothetical protein [Phycisphaerae bacterium]
MDLFTQEKLRRYKWHAIIIVVVIALVIVLTVYTNVLVSSEAEFTLMIVWFLATIIIMTAIITVLAKVMSILKTAQDNNTKLEKIISTLEKNRAILSQLNSSVRLSETARAIAFKDFDKQALREAVFDKLQQKDFAGVDAVIEEIDHHSAYKDLVEQLKNQVQKFREATEQERVNQFIEQIEKLFETYQWTKASVDIEKLIEAFPNSEKARGMRQRLVERKGERKKVLLKAWDDAVNRHDTDRSLEILKELDLYLTPNEALALQEAAKDVFRSKLHNLGVQFSLAVSEKQWQNATAAAQQIIKEFPNSKMAAEIRQNWDMLQQRVEEIARK